jgi:hypothetical protein
MKPSSLRLPLVLTTLLVVTVWHGVTLYRRRRAPSVLAKLSPVAMAYSPDGQILATAANDKTINRE